MTLKKWTRQQNETHDWEKEKVLEGSYVESRVIPTNNGDVNMYTVDKGGGKLVDVWGKAMIDSFFKNMKKGTTIKITHLGLEKSKKGGRTYHNFEFEYDDSTAVQETPEDIPTKDIPF